MQPKGGVSDGKEQGRAAEPEKADYLTKQTLKHRGWTDKLIRQFLVLPDELRTNPRFKCAAPMQLFLCSRVEEIEATTEFQDALSVSKRRSEAGKRAAEKAWEKTLDAAEQIEITVPEIDRERLIQNACGSYNANNIDRLDRDLATPNSDPAFLERICVNYLRHECTGYDSRLNDTYRSIGASDAKEIIRGKVYDAIAEKYPDLAAECQRQEERRREQQRYDDYSRR